MGKLFDKLKGYSDEEYDEVCQWLKEKDFPHDDKKVREE